jgi:DNA-binding NarL/FixJ family response regulator
MNTDDPSKTERCYELGCSIYITKPVDYERFIETINRLGLILTIIEVPKVNHET